MADEMDTPEVIEVSPILSYGRTFAGLSALAVNVVAWIRDVNIGTFTTGVTLTGGAIISLVFLYLDRGDKRRERLAEFTRKQNEADIKVRELERERERENAIKDRAIRMRIEKSEVRMAQWKDRQNVTLARKVDILSAELAEARKLVAATNIEASVERSEIMKTVKSIEIDRNRKQRILIVDDDCDTCQILGKNFESKGYVVECANTLAEAKRKFNGTCYWVIVDLYLEDGSGLEMLRHIKSLQRNVKVCIITGADNPDVLDAADRNLADLALKKTGNFDYLYAKLRELDDKAPRPTVEDLPATLALPAPG